MIGSSNSNGRPRLACEIGVDRVIAARADQNHTALEVHSARKLASGSINPGLSGENVSHSDALCQSIAGALESLAGNSRDVIAILPDAAVRVLLLDFEDLPSRSQDAASVIRFRVKKSLPFDVDLAALSFEAHRGNGAVKVVAAFSPHNVIQEYEKAFQDAGYAPGVVLPSTVATLGVVEASRPTMIVKVDALTTTVAIVNQADLILMRTLEHPGRTVLTARDLASNVLSSMVFFEDTFSSRVEHILLTGLADVPGLAAGLEQETGTRVEELVVGGNVLGDGLGEVLPHAMLNGVAGALLG